MILLPLVGLRLGALQPVDAVSYSQILAATPREPLVSQGTLRGSAHWNRLAAELSVPWVVTAGGGLSDGGPGRIRGALGAWVGRERAWQLGTEVASWPAEGPRGSVVAWATRARNTVPGTEWLGFVSYAHPSGRWGARGAAGIQYSTFVGTFPYYVPLVGELAVVTQHPLAGRWLFAAEVDLSLDETFLTARPAARYAAEHVQVDLGLQLPLPALQETVTFQPFVQLRVFD